MNRHRLLIISMFFFGLVFLFSLLLIIVPAIVSAATIEVSWTYTPEQQAKINKFRIYDQDHIVIVDDIPAADRAANFNTEDKCRGWYIVAAAGTGEKEIESDASNIIGWCPPAPEKPPVPAVFSVSGTLRIEAVQK